MSDCADLMDGGSGEALVAEAAEVVEVAVEAVDLAGAEVNDFHVGEGSFDVGDWRGSLGEWWGIILWRVGDPGVGERAGTVTL